MHSVDANREKTLLVISAAGRVTQTEVESIGGKVQEVIGDFAPGFKTLTDFRFLDTIEPGAAKPLALIMDALAAKQVALIVRVLPDARKDIGLAILSHFHYGPEIQIMTCETVAEAVDLLTQ